MGDSIAKRYAITFLSRAVGLGAHIATAGIVPRSLGATDYGSFQFLQAAFQQVKNVADLGSSSAFFTHCSKHQRSGLILLAFGLWELLQLAGILLLVAAAVYFGFAGYLWPNQATSRIFLLAGIVVLQAYQQRFLNFADSKGLTSIAQILKLGINLLQITLMVFLFLGDRLHLQSYIGVHYLVLGFSLLLLWAYLRQRRRLFYEADFSRERLRELLRYFTRYCSPLVVYTLAGTIFGYFNRWFLQWVEGNAEQGLYALSFNWSQIILIFTSAMLPIYWREVSLAFGQNDLDRIRYLFNKFIHLLYVLTVFFAAFICTQAEFLVTHVAGASFTQAAVPFMLMSFYPVHQTYGQISGVLFMATERTRQYRNISLAAMTFGGGLTYFLLAPPTFVLPGLGLGALGLALQMIIVQFFIVNIQLFFNCRYLGLSFRSFLIHQVAILGGAVAVALAADRLCMMGFDSFTLAPLYRDWLRFLAAGMLYSFVAGAILVARPELAGTSRRELLDILRRARLGAARLLR